MRPEGFPQLNFPSFEPRLQHEGGKWAVWDDIRKKHLTLTPEEWVRQHLIHYLLKHLHYPAGLTLLEKKVNVNGLPRRLDLAVMNPNGEYVLLAECKAPEVELTPETVYQIAAYAKPLSPKVLLLTNGLRHICFKVGDGGIQFLEEIPSYNPA